MLFRSDDGQPRYPVIPLIAAVALGIALATGLVLDRGEVTNLVPAASPSGAAPIASQAQSDASSITVEYGVVKFYFSSGKAELAAGAGEALTDVVKGASSGKMVIISGFHDARGNAAFNAELASQRALAVRDMLRAAGVADSRISVKKPEQLTGTGSDAEARRVEITLQ